jgi:glycosyltransferase involved in cell wall biosynthesis
MVHDRFEKRVTVVVKSFERKAAVHRLVESIRKKYAAANIIIVDDSRTPLRLNGKHIKTVNLDFNCGLSTGRNVGLRLVDTPYFLLCDDDFVFSGKSDVFLLTERLVEYGADISAGLYDDLGVALRHFYGSFSSDGNSLVRKLRVGKNLSRNVIQVDFAPNFFVGKTEAVLRIGWDEHIKIGYEHEDFFLCAMKCKLKSIVNTDVNVLHLPYGGKEYLRHRFNTEESFKAFRSKHNYTQIYDCGNLYSKYDYTILKLVSAYKKLQNWHSGDV